VLLLLFAVGMYHRVHLRVEELQVDISFNKAVKSSYVALMLWRGTWKFMQISFVMLMRMTVEGFAHPALASCASVSLPAVMKPCCPSSWRALAAREMKGDIVGRFWKLHFLWRIPSGCV
jgi:hypothetical protein